MIITRVYKLLTYSVHCNIYKSGTLSSSFVFLAYIQHMVGTQKCFLNKINLKMDNIFIGRGHKKFYG